MEDKVIIVIKDGLEYNISETALIQDFKKEKYIPDTDKLLDWRLFLMKAEPKTYMEKYILTLEILATDYLLKLKHEYEKQS